MKGTVRLISNMLIIAAIVAMSGCAFGTRKPTLIYPPSSEKPMSPQEMAMLKQKNKGIQVVVEKFADRRTNKATVGTVRNGFGMRTADVVPTNNVSDWVTQAVVKELENNGYTIVEPASVMSTNGKAVIVSGDIINAYCDMYLHYNAYVTLDMNATMDGHELIKRRYEKEGSQGVVWAASSESFAESLALALSSAVKEFVNDLGQSLAKQEKPVEPIK